MKTLVPTFRVNHRRAADAFAVHAALLKAERLDPSLKHNPQWIILRQDAYEHFATAFEAV